MNDRNLLDSWTRLLGVDVFDSVVHVVTTLGVSAVLMQLFDSPWPGVVVVGLSLLIYSWRRRRALSRMPEASTGTGAAGRIEELEMRVAELEQDNARVMELEERLDFTERLLSQAKTERPIRHRTPTGGSAT